MRISSEPDSHTPTTAPEPGTETDSALSSRWIDPLMPQGGALKMPFRLLQEDSRGIRPHRSPGERLLVQRHEPVSPSVLLPKGVFRNVDSDEPRLTRVSGLEYPPRHAAKVLRPIVMGTPTLSCFSHAPVSLSKEWNTKSERTYRVRQKTRIQNGFSILPSFLPLLKVQAGFPG